MDETRIAYAEVDAILDLLEDKYANRIPTKIREFFENEKDFEYKPNIIPSKLLSDQNLKRETYVLLTILELNYWCNSEEEKQEILKELSNNEELKQEELYKKYNPDNIFKKKNEIDNSIQEEIALVGYKEQSFIRKILEKILRIFKR